MELKKHFEIARHIAKMRIMEHMDEFYIFLIIALGILAQMGLTIIFFKAIYARVDTIGGWDINQTYILLGFFFLIQNISWSTYLSGFRRLPYMIENGNLDRVMVLPVKTRVFLIYRFVEVIFTLPQFITAISLFVYGIIKTESALGIPQFVLLFFCALVLHYSVVMLIASLNFYYIIYNTGSLIEEIINLGRYPITIYKGLTRLILSVVVPIAFIFTVPVRAIMGQVKGWEIIAAIILTLIFYKISVKFWNFSLSRYKSAMG